MGRRDHLLPDREGQSGNNVHESGLIEKMRPQFIGSYPSGELS